MAAYGITIADLGGKAKARRGPRAQGGQAGQGGQEWQVQGGEAAQAGSGKIPQCRDRGNLVRARQGAQMACGAGGSGAQA